MMCGVECGKPVLQVLGTKRLPENVRYRVGLSDGTFLTTYAVLATELNSYGDENQLTDNTIIRVDKHIVSEISQEKKVIVILELTILHTGTEVKVKIGNPVPLNDANMAKMTVASASSSTASSIANSLLNSSVMSSHLTCSTASLAPYRNKWVIKARVTSKSNVREWKNANGEGKLFSIDLMDESGEIRAVCFNELCDKYFHMIQVNKVYYISKCQVKLANKRFSTTINNDYEMTFNSDTVVEECADGHVDVPKFSYNLVPLSQISQMEANATVDVAGVCREVGDIVHCTAKTTGRELKKRDVTLIDRSRSNVSLTLWGQDAENFDGTGNPIVFVKCGRINEFNGKKSISMKAESSMTLNPELSDLSELRQWRDSGCPGVLLERIRNVLASAEIERLSWESSADKEGVRVRVFNVENTYGCRMVHSELDGKRVQFILRNSNVTPEIGDVLFVKFDENHRYEIEDRVMYSFVDKVIKLND
ncbi:hypothetical protein HA402_011197 [Bradysia odoriphaga]|nr:hypothetical protein HA402_011197 [Bradysia odoriphaga]